MNEKHCNFLINHGAATAADIEALGVQLQRLFGRIAALNYGGKFDALDAKRRK